MRQQTCTTVTLRQRPIRNGRISLYLDYYPAVRNPKTVKLSRREYLGFYIYATPKNAIELDYNNEILAKAELIRCRRQEAVINEEFGFMDRHKMRADFMAYFKEVCRKKDHKWHIVYLHFEKFVNGKCMFGERQSQPASATLRNIFEKALGRSHEIEFLPWPCIYFLSNLGNFPVSDRADVRPLGYILPDQLVPVYNGPFLPCAV